MKVRRSLIAAAMLSTLISGANAQKTDLTNLYQKAVENDLLVSQVALQKEISDTLIDVQSAGLLPQINAYFAVQALKDSRDVQPTYGGTGSASEAGVTLSQALYNPTVKIGVNIAEQNNRSAEILLTKAEEALVLRTANAYFNVLRAKDLIEAESANIKAIEEYLAQTELRLRLGVASDLDYQEAKAQYDNAKARRIRADALLESRLDVLKTLTNESFTGVEPLDKNLFYPEVPTSLSGQSWEKAAQRSNRDIQLASTAIETAHLQVKRAKAGHLPTVSLVAGVQKTIHMDAEANLSTGGSADVDVDSNLTSADIAVSANVPLYSGGRTTSLVKAATLELDIAHQVLEETHRNVDEQTAFAERNTKTALESLSAYEQSLKSAESALIAVQKGYEAGTRTMSEVLTATGHVYLAQVQVANARYDFIEQALTLKFIAGELSEKDITAINASLKKQNI